jgi:uncharacterized protein YqgV (UPF0045/DUF77 family)
MREVPKKMTISCQLAFVSLGDPAYLNSVQEALNLIEASGLECTIGPMSTVIKGNLSTILELLNTICSAMKDKQFLINLSLSNTCGCEISTGPGDPH